MAAPGRAPPRQPRISSSSTSKESAVSQTLPLPSPADQDIAAGPALEPSTQAFLDGLPNGPPIYSLTPAAARDVLTGVQTSVTVVAPPADIEDRELAIGPTGRTSVRIVRPAGLTGVLPVVIYTHGGGWVLGDKLTHDRLVRDLAAGAGAVVVFVDYDRSPEARYPIALEQAYAVAEHVAQNAEDFGADPARLAIAGDSVGGNMTAALALMAKARRGPKIAAQLLFYPVTDASMASGSYDTFADGPWLTRQAMAWYWDQYLPDKARRSEIYASPLNASLEQLRGLPQALLIVDENDVLRDEGEAYGRKLAAAGVPVVSARYNGTIHDFMMLNPICGTPAARGAVGQAIGYLRAVFAVR
jgi:acetyl esterase